MCTSSRTPLVGAVYSLQLGVNAHYDEARNEIQQCLLRPRCEKKVLSSDAFIQFQSLASVSTKCVTAKWSSLA